MMIRLPRCSKLRSQQVSKLSCGWIWMRKKREQVSIFLILPQPNVQLTGLAVLRYPNYQWRASRCQIKFQRVVALVMGPQILRLPCSHFVCTNSPLKLNVGAFSLRFVCEFEQTWILSTAKLRDSQEDGNEWWTTWSVWEARAGGLCLNSISSFVNPTHSKSFQHWLTDGITDRLAG